MNPHSKGLLPEEVESLLEQTDCLSDEAIKELLKALSLGNRKRRAALWVLYNSPERWHPQECLKPAGSGKSGIKAFGRYLAQKKVGVSASDLSRTFDACRVEVILGESIGTHKESVLRPLFPLLKKGKQPYITSAWNAALQEADGKSPKARHVAHVMEQDEFTQLTAKKSKKVLPIGNTKEVRKKLRRDIKANLMQVKSADDLNKLLKKIEQLIAKQT